jgi:hypothetical protein
MDRFRLIRGLDGCRPVAPPPPRESRYTLFLKLVKQRLLDGLVLGHYVTNPDEPPDHVFHHDCRFRTFTQGDFETTRWTVKALTEEEDALLEWLPGKSRSEHLMVLSDESGNVILQDYCTAHEAEQAMARVEKSVGGAS